MSLSVDTRKPSPEIVQRAIFYNLFEKLNPALAEEAALWEQSDRDIALLREIDYVETNLQPVDKKNFYEGFRPAMIERPVGEYPNVSVVVNQMAEDPTSAAWDHQDIFRSTVVIEAMVKATLKEGEEICNRRAQRMRNALVFCLSSDPTFGGAVSGIEPGMTTRLSTLFSRPQKDGRPGNGFLWQAAQIEFPVRKETARNGNRPDLTRPYLSDDTGIDQD